MKSLIRIAVLTALGVGAISSASATTVLSFGVTGVGSYTVNTGDITAGTTTKNIPANEQIGGTTTPTAFADAGLTTGAAATFSTLTFSTAAGPISPFTLSAGTLGLVLTFTNISNVTIVPSKPAGQPNPNGSISEQFNGTVTGGTGTAAQFVGQTVSISETCTQTSTGASITCSESVLTPGLPINQGPEPSSLALIGAGLAGLGALRRRRKAS